MSLFPCDEPWLVKWMLASYGLLASLVIGTIIAIYF